MLTLVIAAIDELWDPVNEEFISSKEQSIVIEHSLVSISKWESKWKTPYFSRKQKTKEQLIDYIKCMTITQNVKDDCYYCLSKENLVDIQKYLDDSMTATWFSDNQKKSSSRRIVTSEVIYSQMVEYGIPFDPCQKWHINRLLTLIRVCAANNTSEKKMSGNDIHGMYSSLNAQRRKALHSKG